MSKTLFSKIIDREIPAEILYEDEYCLAFSDINPQAPTHILVVPKKEIPSITEMHPGDRDLIGNLFLGVNQVVKKFGLEKQGYRLVINNGEQVGQTVFHLHVHILSGREFTWPPG